MERKRDSILIATGAALLTFFVLLLLFGYKERLPGQESTFIYGDGFSIYSNFISGFWRQLLSGERIDYSFSTTMGMPSIAIFSSAICPFNIIYLCFSDPDTAACLATFLKIMTASAAFSMLLKKTQSISNGTGIVFGAAYGLCGYVLNFYYIYIFLDQVYMLPIIVLLLRRLMKTGHWKLLSVAYAYLFIVQIYGGYVTGIITGVLYLILGWYYFGKNLEQWKKFTFLFARCVLIAVLISMIYVLPEMGELFRYTEGDAESFTGTGMKAADLIGALYIGVQGEIYNHWPIIYSTIVALIAVVCWFLEPEIQKEKKIVAIIIFLFLIITTVVPPLYLLMHAGNNPDGVAFRFSYFYSFVLLYIASDYVSAREESIKKREILVVGIVAVLYIILYILNSFLSLTKTISESGLIWNILFLLGYMLVFLRKNRKTNRLLLLLMTSELVCNGGLMLQNEAINNTINRKYYQAWQQQLEGALQEIDNEEEKEPWLFYRLYIPDTPCPNVSMRYGYHGIGMFYTVEHLKLRHLLQVLGYAGATRTISDYGSDPFMQMLFAQKYRIYMPYRADDNIQSYAVIKNEDTLPIGYMVSEQVLNANFDSSNAFENRNRLAMYMTGSEHNIYHEYDGEIIVKAAGILPEFMADKVLLHYNGDGGIGRMDIYIKQESDMPLFLYVSRWGYHISVEGSPQVITSGDMGTNWTPSFLTMPHIQPIPTNSEGEGCASILMQPSKYNDIAYEKMHFAYFDENEKKQVYNDLAEHIWELQSFSQTDLTGSVEVTTEYPILFTSIPYDEGWHAEVDGIETETIPVMEGAFLAVPMTNGEHNVHLYYRNERILQGGLLAALGMILLLMSWLSDGKHTLESAGRTR